MSKEILKPQQFGKVDLIIEDQDLKLSADQIKELNQLYENTVDKLKRGQLIIGKVVTRSGCLQLFSVWWLKS